MYTYEHYIFNVLFVLTAISVVAVVRCPLRGREAPRKKLLHSVLLLGGIALICFGGEAVLAQFDMGWRCTPFNIMLFLCIVLFVATLLRCMRVVVFWENADRGTFAFFSLGLMLVVTLGWTFLYFQFESWNDHLAPHNGQMIVCADDSHGGSCDRRYYVHINDLVHGAEIEHDGYWGYTPPLWS